MTPERERLWLEALEQREVAAALVRSLRRRRDAPARALAQAEQMRAEQRLYELRGPDEVPWQRWRRRVLGLEKQPAPRAYDPMAPARKVAPGTKLVSARTESSELWARFRREYRRA